MPSIFGIFNIRILINDELLKLSNKEIEYVLMHEISHYKRKDNLLNILITLLRIIYIFNPIVFIVLNKVKKDLELATDENAMIFNDKEEQKEYCKTLLKLATLNSDKFLVQTLCLTDEKKNLERRIDSAKLMNKFKENKKQIALISLILIVFIILVLFTRNSEYMSRRDIIKLIGKNENLDNCVTEISEKYYFKEMPSGKIIDETLNKYYIYRNSNGKLIDREIFDNKFKNYTYIDYENAEEINIDEQQKIMYMQNDISDDYMNYFTSIKELLKDRNNSYKYCGKEKLDEKSAYIIELTYKIDSFEEGRVVLERSKEKFGVNAENGLVLKISQTFDYPTQNQIVDRIAEFNYDFNSKRLEDVKKPNIYDYKDYKTSFPFMEFEEVINLVKQNVKNEKALKDIIDIDTNKYSYRRDSYLKQIDEVYVYNIFLTNKETGEYYKFTINYDDNLVRTMETGILDEQSNETNKVIIDY